MIGIYYPHNVTITNCRFEDILWNKIEYGISGVVDIANCSKEFVFRVILENNTYINTKSREIFMFPY